MNNLTIEEKKLMLLEIQEHPEKYTEEQINELLADKEVKAFLIDSSRIKRGMLKQNPAEIDVEAEWEKFISKNEIQNTQTDFSQNEQTESSQYSKFRILNYRKFAAASIGIILISGMAFAAIHFFHPSEKQAPKQEIEKVVPVDSVKTSPIEKKDTIDMRPVVFEDAELHTILTQMADFYQVKVNFQNEQVGKTRLYFNWDKHQSLNHCIEILNGFERINITYSNNTLTIE